MTSQLLVLSAQNTAADTIESIYDAPSDGNGTEVRNFTATNNTDSNKTYIAYIFAATGSEFEAVTPRTILVRDRASLAPEMVNQVIPAGGSIRVESSAAESVAFTISGKPL